MILLNFLILNISDLKIQKKKAQSLIDIEPVKVIHVISDPNLFKCIMDPDVRQHVFSVYRVLNYSQLNEYKRNGKVSFVPC